MYRDFSRTATDWILEQAETRGLSIGYFGSSTSAAAALAAAAQRPDVIDAVVSRGGRPDLAGQALRHVEAPTLLIVGGNDVSAGFESPGAGAVVWGEKARDRAWSWSSVPGTWCPGDEVAPQEIVAAVRRTGCRSVAYTYTEPIRRQRGWRIQHGLPRVWPRIDSPFRILDCAKSDPAEWSLPQL